MVTSPLEAQEHSARVLPNQKRTKPPALFKSLNGSAEETDKITAGNAQFLFEGSIIALWHWNNYAGHRCETTEQIIPSRAKL